MIAWKPAPVLGWAIAWRNDSNGDNGYLWGECFSDRRVAWQYAQERLGEPKRKLYRAGLRVLRVKLVPTVPIE